MQRLSADVFRNRPDQRQREKPADQEKRVFSFTDAEAVKGNTYNYRLMLCEDNGNCSEAATAEINFK